MNYMDRDLQRAIAFAEHPDILMPYDEEQLPLSVDSFDGKIYWIAFESPELGRTSSAVNLSLYNWGQMSGLQYLKFLHERIVKGGKHHLIINPGTERQVGMNNESISQFLHWLEEQQHQH